MQCRRFVVAALWVLASAVQGQAVKNDSLQVIFFDVGQGDAAMIVTPDGKRVLIDAGPSGAQIVPQLTALGVKSLDLVVASHNHADHIGGMPDVFEAFQVKAYTDNGIPALTRVYRRTVEAVENEKGLKVFAATPREFKLGKAAVRILTPPHQDDSQNDNSIGIWLQYGSFTAVFSGDAEQKELDWWMGAYNLPSVGVLKAGHHGSINGVTEDWMRMMAPRIVVISVGADNQYGHPSKDVLLGWAGRGARVYRTDAVGTITISAAENGRFSVRTTSGEMPWVTK